MKTYKIVLIFTFAVVMNCQYGLYDDYGYYNNYGQQSRQMELDRYSRSQEQAINRDMVERHRCEDRLYREQRRIERGMREITPLPPADFGQIGDPRYDR